MKKEKKRFFYFRFFFFLIFLFFFLCVLLLLFVVVFGLRNFIQIAIYQFFLFDEMKEFEGKKKKIGCNFYDFNGSKSWISNTRKTCFVGGNGRNLKFLCCCSCCCCGCCG